MHGREPPVPPLVRPERHGAFLASQMISCPLVEAQPLDRATRAGEAKPNKSAELMIGRANW